MHGSRFKTNKMEDRFWEKVIKTETCWVWRHIIKGRRYGTLRVGNRMEAAHRVSWRIHFGTIPDKLYVRHKCDNPTCVRPEHLEIGTQQDNMNDMVFRNRQSKGSLRPGAKLTESQVKDIRGLYATGSYGKEQLSKMFNVSERNVRSILDRKTWKHVI